MVVARSSSSKIWSPPRLRSIRATSSQPSHASTAANCKRNEAPVGVLHVHPFVARREACDEVRENCVRLDAVATACCFTWLLALHRPARPVPLATARTRRQDDQCVVASAV